MEIGKIYWIDDDVEKMMYIVEGAFPQLWNVESENGIANSIIIFGNAFDEDNDLMITTKDEQEYIERLRNKFVEICQNEDGPKAGNETFNAHKELIQNPIKFIFKKDDAENIALYHKVKEIWTKSNLEEKNIKEDAKQGVSEIIKKMEIPEDALVGIDVALLYEDDKRVKKETPIISMELYHQLREKKQECFLYSSEGDDEEFVEKWIKTYNKFYEKEETVDIYYRADFMPKGSEIAVKEIKKMIKAKEYDYERDERAVKMGNFE